MRERLSIATSSWEEFILRTKRMAAAKIDRGHLDAFLLDLYRVKVEDAAIGAARRSKSYKRITALFNGEGIGAALAGKTLWGAVNAVTQYVDYERGISRETGLDAAWFGEGALLKDRAFSLAQQHLALADLG